MVDRLQLNAGKCVCSTILDALEYFSTLALALEYFSILDALKYFSKRRSRRSHQSRPTSSSSCQTVADVTRLGDDDDNFIIFPVIR